MTRHPPPGGIGPKAAGRTNQITTSNDRLRTESDERLITVDEAANFLQLSVSWLAKARMRGDGPAYVKAGRSVRYRASALQRWLKLNERFSRGD